MTEPNAISNFLVINDGLGGTFNFNATSVETTSFSNSPGRSTIIGLYVLGSMGDTNLRENPTPTDLLITLTSLFGEPFSAGATLSDPPVPPPVIAGTTVPEPATLALLATGLLGVGLARRKRPQ